jgi:hypothetical protein
MVVSTIKNGDLPLKNGDFPWLWLVVSTYPSEK